MPEDLGTQQKRWKLKTPPGTSDYLMYLDERGGEEVIVCGVGATTLLYAHRAIDDLHGMLKQRSDWMALGSADKQKPAKDGTVESWARSESNPINLRRIAVDQSELAKKEVLSSYQRCGLRDQ